MRVCSLWRPPRANFLPIQTTTGRHPYLPPCLAEELNRAYAMHEIVGDHLTACLAWLEARGTLPLAGLAQQFAAARLPGPRLRDLSPRRLGMLPMRRRR